MDDSKYKQWKIGGEKAWVELQAENGVFVTGLGNDQVGNLSPEWRRSFLLVNGAPVDVKKVERAAGACKLEFGFDGGTGVLAGRPSPDDAAALFSLSLRSDARAREVSVSVGRFYLHLSDYYLNWRFLCPYFGGALQKRWDPFRVYYPGPAGLCASVAVHDDGVRGVGFGAFNEEQRRVLIEGGPMAGVATAALTYELVTLPASGQAVRLPDFFISVGGDWGELLRPYQRWYRACFGTTRNVPDWLKRADRMFVQYPHSGTPDTVLSGEAQHPYNDEEAVRMADETLDGLAKIYPERRGLIYSGGGWWKSEERWYAHVKAKPHDVRESWGECTTGDYLQARYDMARVVRHAHERNGAMVLYVHGYTIGSMSDFWPQHPESIIRGRDGEHEVSDGMNSCGDGWIRYLLCHGTPAARELYEQTADRIVGDWDADGIFLDQIGGGRQARYCFDPAHRHEHPDVIGENLLDFLKWFRARIKKLKPDGILAGELTHDARLAYMDVQTSAHRLVREAPGPDRGGNVLEYEAFLRYLNPGGLVAVWSGSPEQFRFSLFNGIWLGCVPPDLCAAPDAHLRAIHKLFLDRIDFFTGELEPAPCDAVDGAVHIFSNGSKDQYVLAHAELYGAAGIRTCRPKCLKSGQRVRLTDIEHEFSRETVYDPKEGLKLPPTASVSFYDMEVRQ